MQKDKQEKGVTLHISCVICCKTRIIKNVTSCQKLIADMLVPKK